MLTAQWNLLLNAEALLVRYSA